MSGNCCWPVKMFASQMNESIDVTPVMGGVGTWGRQSMASQPELIGSSAATSPHNCWPRAAEKSGSGCPIPDNAGNGNKKSVTAMKCDGSPGSTPHRFVALTTNQFPVKNSESANVLRAPISLDGTLTMSWNRLNGILKIDESTRRVSMLRIGSSAK